MNDALISGVELPSGNDVGWRLARIELYNWGTFDSRVWALAPGGQTSLLTGDIGSGKSTIVDAITTLLLPANKIAYNKAAGADSKERTLRSYVEGHYKSERNDSGVARAVGLRGATSFSVIIGVFANAGDGKQVTLAQVFQQRDRTGQPYRFYVTTERDLSIAADFADFGTDLTELRRRLRTTGASIDDGFPDYAARYRRLLGIKSEQAMELFHQTVSMKSVGNLDDFVRDHMLEPAEMGERIKDIVKHFDDLDRAYGLVVQARDQLTALGPLVELIDRYDAALTRRGNLDGERAAIATWVVEVRLALLADEIDRQSKFLAAREAEREALASAAHQLSREQDQLKVQRQNEGGDRLAHLDREIEAANKQADQRRDLRNRFDLLLAEVGIPAVATNTEHADLLAQLQERAATLKRDRQTLDQQLVDLNVVARSKRTEIGGLRQELESLLKRTSNLPREQVEIREQLITELGVSAEELPFAGELVDVADEHIEWRGAAERVLRPFALSLLVPQRHYDRVAQWVNTRRLQYHRGAELVGGRLVYERVSDRRIPLGSAPTQAGLLLSDCLVTRDGEFSGYLQDELIKRAAYQCADSIEAFRTADRAVTREGQIKSGHRHEKDDRSRIDDPRTWVLGWANSRKVEAVAEQVAAAERELEGADQQLAAIQPERDATSTMEGTLRALGEYRTWSELDWAESVRVRETLEAERERLRSGSSALVEIEARLADVERRIAEADSEREEVTETIGGLKTSVDRAKRRQESDDSEIRSLTPEDLAVRRAQYPALMHRLGERAPIEADDCDRVADRLRNALSAQVDQIDRQLGGFVTNMQGAMKDINHRWPDATKEMDASPAARDEYRAFHRRVAADDLPRYTEEFEHQLKTNTIRELASLNNWLRLQSEDIKVRVETINEALGALDYNPGRYIRLEPTPTTHSDIVDFRRDLRAVTDDALAPTDDHYSEQRFLDVKKIIERFRGREGHTQRDKDWTALVTDVRHWFTFAASERDRETHQEWEHYQDSDGKSGGQKEKLAYTILAASLAYQFGLKWGAEKARDFRFAVIDEAFGRGSDQSTRYALELFAKLGLQLLIVTPLQKVNVIAPYVKTIGFVDNPTGRASRLQMLTVEEFRLRQAAYA